MAGVLVIGDATASGLASDTLRVAAAGAQVADAFGEPLIGALIGADLTRAAGAFQCGLASLYLVEGAHYRPYTSEAYVAAARAVIEATDASVVVVAQGAETREWVPRLAARIHAGLVMDCAALKTEARTLVVIKPVNGGGVAAEFAVHGKPAIVTVRASGFEPQAAGNPAQRIYLDVPPPTAPITVLEEQTLGPSGGPKLKDAKIIVAGGRGVGGPDNWHFIEETSSVLGAAVGCSRPVADSGWVPSAHQVGLSGTSVAPDLYIAVGISGAAQHLAGISGARTVVAINNSAEAEIFSRADYGIVDDFREVLPAFVERVRELHSKRKEEG